MFGSELGALVEEELPLASRGTSNKVKKPVDWSWHLDGVTVNKQTATPQPVAEVAQMMPVPSYFYNNMAYEYVDVPRAASPVMFLWQWIPVLTWLSYYMLSMPGVPRSRTKFFFGLFLISVALNIGWDMVASLLYTAVVAAVPAALLIAKGRLLLSASREGIGKLAEALPIPYLFGAKISPMISGKNLAARDASQNYESAYK